MENKYEALEARMDQLLEAYGEAVERKDHDRVAEVEMETMEVAAEMAAVRPPSDRLGATTSAREFEERGDFDNAEACYVRAVELAQSEPNEISRSMGTYRALADLSSFYSWWDRDEEALANARAALVAARSADVTVLTGMALAGVATLELTMRNPSAAFEAADEMVRVSTGDPLYDFQRAQALTLRAAARIELNHLKDASADLEDAGQLLAPNTGMTSLYGSHPVAANWWDRRAKLAEALSQPDEALKSYSQAVQSRRALTCQMARRGMRSLANTLERYAGLLDAAGESGGTEARAEAEALRAR